MEQLLIINASPRARNSNSKRYAALFSGYCSMATKYVALTRTNHDFVRAQIADAHCLLLVFPLYADGIPSTLLQFFKVLQSNPPLNKPTISILINCGFLEPSQNDVAVEMVRLFCVQNGYPFASVLKIGSGEAILDSPFRFLVKRKIRRFVKAVTHMEQCVLQVTMPLSKKLFIRASTQYWTRYGAKNGLTRRQMQSMQIEPDKKARG